MTGFTSGLRVGAGTFNDCVIYRPLGGWRSIDLHFLDGVALEGIRLISRHLLPAVEDGSNIEARYYMALGSLYGGSGIVEEPLFDNLETSDPKEAPGEFEAGHVPGGITEAGQEDSGAVCIVPPHLPDPGAQVFERFGIPI